MAGQHPREIERRPRSASSFTAGQRKENTTITIEDALRAAPGKTPAPAPNAGYTCKTVTSRRLFRSQLRRRQSEFVKEQLSDYKKRHAASH